MSDLEKMLPLFSQGGALKFEQPEIGQDKIDLKINVVPLPECISSTDWRSSGIFCHAAGTMRCLKDSIRKLNSRVHRPSWKALIIVIFVLAAVKSKRSHAQMKPLMEIYMEICVIPTFNCYNNFKIIEIKL